MVSTFWTKGGKPDYAKSASWIASLPPDLRDKFNSTDEEVLRRIITTHHASAVNNRDGKARLYFSQSWLSEVVGVCVRQIRRSIRKLEGLGLIETIHRRPEGDVYKSNITKLGKRLLSLFYRLFTKKSNKIAPDINVPQEPKEGTRSARQGSASREPKEISSLNSEPSLPFQLDADGREVRVQGERQVKSGWLTQAMLQHRSTAAQEAEAKKGSKSEELRAYWEKIGFSGLPIRG